VNKVLIIEDDVIVAEIYSDKFQADGFETEIVGDGGIAIKRLKINPPDLVILDLMLPTVDGVQVLKFIRSQDTTRALPVIVTSNAYANGLVQAAWNAGANNCLAKDACAPRHLVEEARNLLASTGALLSAPVTASATSPARPPAPVARPALVGKTGKPAIDLRRALLNKMPQRLVELRQLLKNLSKADNTTIPARLFELYRSVHNLAGSASFAGLTHIARLSCALEALLKELHLKPKHYNSSVLRTIAQAITLLKPLSQQAGNLREDAFSDPLIMVVDDDLVSRTTTYSALEQVNLRAVCLGDPALALKLLDENRFDLIFLDVEMPGLNGFEVCEKLHASAANPRTPVVFVTVLDDFETRARSALSGGIDFIAKPVLLIELAVKALTHLLCARMELAR
jgi:CheY-like chemotaxis protein